MNHSMPLAARRMGKVVPISAQKTAPGGAPAHQKACTRLFGYGTVFDSHPDGCILRERVQPARGKDFRRVERRAERRMCPRSRNRTPRSLRSQDGRPIPTTCRRHHRMNPHPCPCRILRPNP